jgi:ABC-type nitrate/sulfonate/bicarbonate transport system substrate-binding protein
MVSPPTRRLAAISALRNRRAVVAVGDVNQREGSRWKITAVTYRTAKVAVFAALVCVFAAQAGATPALQQKATTTSITIVWNGVTVNSIMPLIAQQKGFFPSDLNVTVTPEASTQIAGSLSTNQAQIAYLSAPNLELAFAAGAKVAWLATVQPYPDIALVAPASISNMASFKGKTLAVTAPGTFGALMTNWALAAGGLTSNDFTIAPLGTAGAILAAFTSGQVQGWATNSPTLQAALSAVPGSHIVYDLYKEKVDWVGDGIAANSDWVKQHPHATVEILQALQKAQAYFFANPNKTEQIIQQAIPSISASDINTGYNWVAGRMSKTLMPVATHTILNERRFLLENGFSQASSIVPKQMTLPVYLQQALRKTK